MDLNHHLSVRGVVLTCVLNHKAPPPCINLQVCLISPLVLLNMFLSFILCILIFLYIFIISYKCTITISHFSFLLPNWEYSNDNHKRVYKNYKFSNPRVRGSCDGAWINSYTDNENISAFSLSITHRQIKYAIMMTKEEPTKNCKFIDPWGRGSCARMCIGYVKILYMCNEIHKYTAHLLLLH